MFCCCCLVLCRRLALARSGREFHLASLSCCLLWGARWLWRHSNSCYSTAAKRANGQHLSRHSNSTATSLCPCPCPHPCPWSSFPLSVGMLTMIMKPASGRAARVAKQQVGPHSALPCPGLPACPLPFPSPPWPRCLYALTHRYTERHSMQLFLGLFALRFRFRFWFRFRFPFLCRCDKTREIFIICALTFSSSIPCSLSFALALSACHFCALSRSRSFVV